MEMIMRRPRGIIARNCEGVYIWHVKHDTYIKCNFCSKVIEKMSGRRNSGNTRDWNWDGFLIDWELKGGFSVEGSYQQLRCEHFLWNLWRETSAQFQLHVTNWLPALSKRGDHSKSHFFIILDFSKGMCFSITTKHILVDKHIKK